MLFELFNRSKVEEFRGIPGPTPWWPVGNLLDFVGRRQPWEVLAEYARTYGGMTNVWMGSKPTIALNDPDLIGEVLETRMDDFYKDAPHQALAPIIRKYGLFISNGDHWRFMRENSPFNTPGFPDWLRTQFTPARDILAGHLHKFCGQRDVEIVETVRRMSYDVFSHAMWGHHTHDTSWDDFVHMATHGSRRMTTMRKMPKIKRRFEQIIENWYSGFETCVREALDKPDPDSNALLHVVARHGTKLSPQELTQSLSAAVYFGGVFSLASAVATTLYCLAGRPDFLQRVRAEVDAIGVFDDGFSPEALNSCKLLDHALRESMRLLTPVPVYFRNVVKEHEVELGGHTLPADTVLMLTNWFLHRDPKHWDNPDKYEPERWDNGGVERDYLGSGWFFPFGRGPRTCVGEHFSWPYMKLTLATILSTTEVELDPTQPYRQGFFFGVMFPKRLKARFRPRQSAP